MISTILALWCVGRRTTMMEFLTKFTFDIWQNVVRRRCENGRRCEQSSLHYLHTRNSCENEMKCSICALSLYLSFVFLFELPPTMKIHIFIYRKVSLRIELVVSHLISSHLMRIVLFSFQQNLFRPGCVYRYRGRKRTRQWREKNAHTNRTEVVVFASHVRQGQKLKKDLNSRIYYVIVF